MLEILSCKLKLIHFILISQSGNFQSGICEFYSFWNCSKFVEKTDFNCSPPMSYDFQKKLCLKDSALEWRFHGLKFQKSYDRVRCFVRFLKFLKRLKICGKTDFNCSPPMSYDFPEKAIFEGFCPRMTILWFEISKILW